MKIFVPSIDRVEVCATYTGKALADSGLAGNTYIVVPKEQIKQYKRALPRFKVISIPEEYEYRGIGVKRQYILDNLSDRYSFQVDDDITFYERVKHNRAVKTTQVKGMFTLLETWLKEDDIALVSVGVRYMFQARGKYHENNPCIHVLGIDKKIFQDNNICFDAIPLTSDDIYVSLDILVKGYKSRITDEYLQEGLPMNYKGGISRYRDVHAINKSVKSLQEAFPRFVKYRKSIDIKNIGTVLATTIQWKKAYEYGKAVRKMKEFIK